MDTLPPAALWFLPLLMLALLAGGFAWGSWHRGRYGAKHERLEVQFGAWLKSLPDDFNEAEAQLNERLDTISSEGRRQVERRRQELIDLFHKARG